jgi:hypothetical protein
MSKSSHVQTITLPWRKVCAVLPAVTLIGAGIVFGAQADPARDIRGVAVSSNSSAIVVPDTALTMLAVPAPTRPSHYAEAEDGPGLVPPVGSPSGGSAPALVLPAGTLPGSSTPVALDSTGVPIRALEAYRSAASLVGAADHACHIDWALLAAIGRVESNHARFGGNQLDSAGVAQPGIIGIPLDGTNGTARILDTDGGRLDRDKVYDRAVGPMQFIPSTWRVAGADADRDGVKNPQDMADAAAATAIYLCSGPGNLQNPGDLSAAIMRYNASDSYVRTVIAIAAAYRHGVRTLPASDLPAANAAPTTSGVAKAAPRPAARVLAGAAPAVSSPATPVPTTTIPSMPVPTTTIPTTPVPTTTIPTTPVPTLPDPCLPVPTPAIPTLPITTPTNPTAPIPCLTPTAPSSSTPIP